MFGMFSRGRNPPLTYRDPNPSGVSSLREAKLAAWAIMHGAHAPLADAPQSRRRRHGMSDDLPAPDPAPRRSRPSWRAIADAFSRIMGFGGRQPAEAAALSGILTAPVGETAAVTYIHGSDARESGRAPANAGRKAIQSRVA